MKKKILVISLIYSLVGTHAFSAENQEEVSSPTNEIIRKPLVLDSTCFTDAVCTQFRKAYPNLEITSSNLENGKKVCFNTSKLSEKESNYIDLDANFKAKNPHLPLENTCSNMHTFNPDNESQRDALVWAHKLIGYTGGKSCGLFMSGPVGVGKTHLSVAIAKEYMARGENVLFTQKLESVQKSEIKNFTVFIIDDLNSLWGLSGDNFKPLLLHAHNTGGIKIFMTSNTTFAKIFPQAFAGCDAELPRYQDRIKGMIKEINLKGSSYREAESWFNE